MSVLVVACSSSLGGLVAWAWVEDRFVGWRRLGLVFILLGLFIRSVYQGWVEVGEVQSIEWRVWGCVRS